MPQMGEAKMRPLAGAVDFRKLDWAVFRRERDLRANAEAGGGAAWHAAREACNET
jgi:hypothetical protein